MNHFSHLWGEQLFLAGPLPATLSALPNYENKVSSFLASYEVLASVLPRAPPGPASPEVLLALPDIKWPLRVWSHPCASCLRGFVEHNRPCLLLFPLPVSHMKKILLRNETCPALGSSSLVSPEGLSTLPSSSSLQSNPKGEFY